MKAHRPDERCKGEGAQTGGGALWPRPLTALAFRADQKANAESDGEAQDQRIKIEHLLRFAKGGRSTAD